jgi:hypothetical protein
MNEDRRDDERHVDHPVIGGRQDHDRHSSNAAAARQVTEIFYLKQNLPSARFWQKVGAGGRN